MDETQETKVPESVMVPPTTTMAPEKTTSHKIIIIVGAVIVVLVLLAGIWVFLKTTPGKSTNAISPQDAVYAVNGYNIQLKSGVSDIETVHTQIVGNTLTADLNGDGAPDAAVFIEQTQNGRSQLYVAAALKSDAGYTGTNTVLLGASSTPGSLQVKQGMIVSHFTGSGGEARIAYSALDNGVLKGLSYTDALSVVPPAETLLETSLGTVTSTSTIPVTIKPLKVENDSRCPADAACVSQGSATVQAEIGLNGATKTYSFVLGAPMTIDGFGSVTLLNVTPMRYSGISIKDSDYKFVFSIASTKN